MNDTATYTKTLVAPCQPDLHRQVRLESLASGMPIAEIIRRAVAAYLAQAAADRQRLAGNKKGEARRCQSSERT